MNINFCTIEESARETALCCAATITLQLTPGLRLVLYEYPPATINFMADLIAKWLDDFSYNPVKPSCTTSTLFIKISQISENGVMISDF